MSVFRDVAERSVALLVLSFAVSACGSDSPTQLRAGRAAAMELVAGDGQSGGVGKELPNALVVKVLDSANIVVPNQIVNFRVIQGGGSVFAGAAITNANGLAQERWTLGTS